MARTVTRFTRLIVIKNYGGSDQMVEDILRSKDVVYERELLGTIDMEWGEIVDSLWLSYRFKATEEVYRELVQELHKIEGYVEDICVVEAGSVAGEIVRIQRK